MMKTVRWVFMLVVLALAAAIFAAVQMQRYLDTPMVIAESGLEFALKKGGSLNAVAYNLSAQGVLPSPRWLIAFSRLTGRGVSIKAGNYLLESGLTPAGLLNKLEQGDVQYFQLTLVEGWTQRQILAALRAHPRLTSTLDAKADLLTAEALGIQSAYDSLEGLFFPDTYRFHSGTTDVDLLRQAYQRLQQVLAQEWAQRSQGLPYSEPYEALIMASLVEKETGVASERAIIAGVFVRRLQKNMRLQTDPTIIYGLGNSFDGNLRRRHLNDASNIYNTYRHHGLTPTPIALVGREAIHAALHPADGNALYFVAKGDGSHYFSATLEEHQRAVRKYQINQRRKDYSSVPKTNSSS